MFNKGNDFFILPDQSAFVCICISWSASMEAIIIPWKKLGKVSACSHAALLCLEAVRASVNDSLLFTVTSDPRKMMNTA